VNDSQKIEDFERAIENIQADIIEASKLTGTKEEQIAIIKEDLNSTCA